MLAAASGLMAAENETSFEKIGILLDISAEMGHLVPQARKEIKHLNEELREVNRPPVKVIEIDGAGLEAPNSLAIPAKKNAVAQLTKLFDDENVSAVYWVTHMRGFQSGDGFDHLEKLVSDKTASRKLIIKHTWPAELRAGRDWTRGQGDPNADPLHPKNFPKEWLEPVLKSKGRILRSWREIPPIYGAVSAPMKVDAWKDDLTKAYGLHFMKKREYPEYLTDVGKNTIAKRTLIPFLDEKNRESRDAAVFEAMCKRPTLEEDLSKIEAKRLGVLFAAGYQKRDLSLLKNTVDPKKNRGTAALLAIQRLTKEFQAHQQEHSGNLDRIYESFVFEADQSSSRDALKKQNEAIARRAASMIHKYKLDAIYLMTNGFTAGKDYGKFPMSYQPLASFMREKETRLYVRVPFELGVAPYELQQLAVATEGGFLVGPGDEIDPDFKTGPIDAKWPAAE